MIDYILRLLLCSALFVGFYYAFLQSERMHKFNRFYLITAVLLSIFIPLLSFKSAQTTVVAVEGMISSGAEFVGNKIQHAELNDLANVSLTNLLGALYVAITTVLLFRFVVLNAILVGKARKGTRKKLTDAVLVVSANTNQPHSYLHFIFIPETAIENSTIDERIIDHERAHVVQGHTFDILLIELLIVLFWFNPAFYWCRNAMRLNHEFLADESVLHKHKNTLQYQHLLIENAALSNGLRLESAVSCPFNYIKTKKRLTMMTKMKSTQRIVLKQCLLIPIVLLAVTVFSNNSLAHEFSTALDKEVVSGVQASAEEAKITNVMELRRFIALNIKYPSIVHEEKIQADIKLLVKVDKKGKVSNLKNEGGQADKKLDKVVVVAMMPDNNKTLAFDNDSEELKAEVKRVIDKMPLMDIPEYMGKTVEVTVKFRLQEKN